MRSDAALEAFYDQVRTTPTPASVVVSNTSPLRDASLGAAVAVCALFLAVCLSASLKESHAPTVVVGARAYAEAVALEPRPGDSTRGERWIERLA